MTKTLHLIIAVIIAPTYLFSETVTIYATQSAQYSANDCCTLNILTNQNSDSLYSQDCQDMGTYYGCGMSKHAPFWLFDLSILDSSIDIQSIQFNGNIPTEDWSDVYLSVSTTIGQISTSIASDLWSGGDWASGNGQYSSINWAMGDFSQNLPLEIISQGIISGQLNILTYTSNPWTIFSIVNSGDDAPRLVIDYENIDENCTADDGTDGVELWGECYSIENTDSLDLNNSGLTGEIPPEIGNLTNLTDLRLYGNQLTGAIPPEIGNLTNLTRLDLENNQLTGSIPSEIGNLTNLTDLYLYSNQLTGSIPSEIGNLTNLTWLNLYSNQLTGSIPSEIGNLTNLTYLYLNSNQLTREIPESICDLNISWDGWEFNISNNQLCPPYPSCIEDYVGEQDTSNCGECDENSEVVLWGQNYSVENTFNLNLSNSGLTGPIPPGIGCLSNLQKLELQNNQLTGSIPSEIGNLTNLTRLWLYDNELTGEIPDSICSLVENNCNINISNNQLCPSYPSCIEDDVGEQDTTNCGQVSIIDETLPVTYNLYNAYPNPFNPVTTLRYDLPEDAMVNITIYDMMGRQINTLVSGPQNAGYKSIQWDATNNTGQPVSAGLYLYTIQAGKFRQTKKMVLLK